MVESAVDSTSKLNRMEHNYVIISVIIPIWCSPNLIEHLYARMHDVNTAEEYKSLELERGRKNRFLG